MVLLKAVGSWWLLTAVAITLLPAVADIPEVKVALALAIAAVCYLYFYRPRASKTLSR
jgi:hypothetical protein